MPGLRLTLPQAKRLWDLDEQTCVRTLERLVEFGFLCRTACGYARASDGRIVCPRARTEEER
jgi:predicted metalloprotease